MQSAVVQAAVNDIQLFHPDIIKLFVFTLL
jgi:hypothetical protein